MDENNKATYNNLLGDSEIDLDESSQAQNSVVQRHETVQVLVGTLEQAEEYENVMPPPSSLVVNSALTYPVTTQQAPIPKDADFDFRTLLQPKDVLLPVSKPLDEKSAEALQEKKAVKAATFNIRQNKTLILPKLDYDAVNPSVLQLEEQQTIQKQSPIDTNMNQEISLPKKGDFTELSAAQLLALAFKHNFSGQLKVYVTPEKIYTLYFRNGFILGFNNSEHGDHIGKFLVDKQYISKQEYSKTATYMLENGIKLQKALISQKLLTSLDYEQYLREYTKEKILEIFTFSFEKFSLHTSIIPNDIQQFHFGQREILLQGLKSYTPPKQIFLEYENIKNAYFKLNCSIDELQKKVTLNLLENNYYAH